MKLNVRAKAPKASKASSAAPVLILDKKQARFSSLVNLAALAVLFALLMLGVGFQVIDNYIAGVLILVMINIILAVSLNITTGLLGQIALGHAGFMSVGAYTGALFCIHATAIPYALRFVLSMVLAGVAASVFGLIVGVPALRLKGDYLAIITLGFGEIIRVIIENLKFTGGAQGLTGIPTFPSFNGFFAIVFVTMALTVAILFAFVRSRHGRAIKAIREDDIASEACGVSNTYYKVLAFTTSAFFAGIAGAIYAQQMGVLGAKAFNFLKSIDILVIVVLGGLGSLTGSIVAAVGLTALPEALRSFSQYRMLVYSLALIAVMIFKPSGLFGTYEFSLTRPFRRLISRKKNAPPAKKTEGKEGANL